MANDDPRKKPKKKIDASHGKAKTGKVAAKAKKVAAPAAKVNKKAEKVKKVAAPAAKVDKKADKAKKVAVPAAKVDKKADKAKKVAGPAAKVDKKADKAKKVAGPDAKVDKKADKAKKVAGPAAKVDKKADKVKKLAGAAAKVGKNAGRAVGGDAGLAIALDAIEICDAVFEDRDDGVTAVGVAGEWTARVAEDADGAEEGTADDPEVGTDIQSIISCLTCCIRGTMAAAKAAEAIGDAVVCPKCGTKLKIVKNKRGKSLGCPKCG